MKAVPKVTVVDRFPDKMRHMIRQIVVSEKVVQFVNHFRIIAPADTPEAVNGKNVFEKIKELFSRTIEDVLLNATRAGLPSMRLGYLQVPRSGQNLTRNP